MGAVVDAGRSPALSAPGRTCGPPLRSLLLPAAPPLLLQICSVLGADGLVYQEVEDLIAVGHELNPAIERFDASCFDGKYCTGERE